MGARGVRYTTRRHIKCTPVMYIDYTLEFRPDGGAAGRKSFSKTLIKITSRRRLSGEKKRKKKNTKHTVVNVYNYE